MTQTQDTAYAAPTLEGVEVTITIGTKRSLPNQIERIANRVIQEGHPDVVLKEQGSKYDSYQTRIRLGDNYFEVLNTLTACERKVVEEIFKLWVTPPQPKAQRVMQATCNAPMYKGNVATPFCCEPPGHYPTTLHRGNGSYAGTSWGEPE